MNDDKTDLGFFHRAQEIKMEKTIGEKSVISRPTIHVLGEEFDSGMQLDTSHISSNFQIQ